VQDAGEGRASYGALRARQSGDRGAEAAAPCGRTWPSALLLLVAGRCQQLALMLADKLIATCWCVNMAVFCLSPGRASYLGPHRTGSPRVGMRGGRDELTPFSPGAGRGQMTHP
jgi:hypothetical protein